jgi:hypothetical protein
MADKLSVGILIPLKALKRANRLHCRFNMGEVGKGLAYVKSPGGLLKMVELVRLLVFSVVLTNPSISPWPTIPEKISYVGQFLEISPGTKIKPVPPPLILFATDWCACNNLCVSIRVNYTLQHIIRVLFSIKVFLAIAAGTVGYFYKEGPDRDYEKDRIKFFLAAVGIAAVVVIAFFMIFLTGIHKKVKIVWTKTVI